MNLKLLKKRLRNLYTNWIKHKQDYWGGSDVLLVSTPSTISPNSTSHRFYVWLLGDVFVDTIAIFTMKEIHFICNKKKASQLKPLATVANEAVEAQVIIHEKVKGGETEQTVIDRVLSNLRAQPRLEYLSHLLPLPAKKSPEEKEQPMVVGCVMGEAPTSKLLWGGGGGTTKKKSYEFRTVDIKDSLSKFASSAKADGNQNKERLAEENPADDQGMLEKDSTDIYFQAMPKEAEERILMAEVKELEQTLRRRDKKVNVIKLDEIGDKEESSSCFDECNDWVLVDL